jgi:hypothetical protein
MMDTSSIDVLTIGKRVGDNDGRSIAERGGQRRGFGWVLRGEERRMGESPSLILIIK